MWVVVSFGGMLSNLENGQGSVDKALSRSLGAGHLCTVDMCPVPLFY